MFLDDGISEPLRGSDILFHNLDMTLSQISLEVLFMWKKIGVEILGRSASRYQISN